MGLLERIATAANTGRDVVRAESRYSADQWLSEYLIPATTFGFGGNQYASSPYGLTQTLAGNRASEISQTLPGYTAAIRGCPPAFAAQMVRMLVLSQARFTFRNPPSSSRPRRTFGTRELGVLEKPWPSGTTGELLARMEWHAGLAGNAYVYRRPDRLRVLRPDWVAVIFGSQQEPEDAAHALDGELIGFVYCNGGLFANKHQTHTLLPSEVAHWCPMPDPEQAHIGMSWITPAVREIQSDRLSTEHKIRFFEQGATPNLVVKGITAANGQALTKTQFDEIVDMLEQRHSGIANAYRTLYLTAGADATVVGNNFRDMDLKNVQGASETRIASLSRVPAPLLGISEGLAGSSLNAGNFGMARRIFADTWVYPSLQDLAASLASIVNVPADAELWFDVGDMPLLREDAKDAAEIQQVQAATIVSLATGGFTRRSAIAAVRGQDMSLLEEDPNWISVQLQQAAGAGPAQPLASEEGSAPS